jgi:hypothetical protein
VAKAVPLHAIQALGGRGVIALLILDLVTRWGEWSASRPGRALAQGKGPSEPIVQDAGWAPEPVWTQAIGKILSLVPGPSLDRPVVKTVARHYTD